MILQHMYLGYRVNPKLLFVSPFFFFVSSSFSSREKKNEMMNTLGGGTGGGREQQQTRNQEAVGSGDNGDNVVPAKFSSKQSKTSTVTITGTLIVYIVRSFFDSISLSFSL